MQLYIKDGALCVSFCGVTVSDIRVSLEYWGKTENYTDIFEKRWTVCDDGVSARGNVENGGVVFVRFRETEYGVLTFAEWEAGETQTVEQALRLKIWGKLPHRIETAICNRNVTSWPNGNRAAYHMGSDDVTARLLKDQFVTGGDYVAYKSDGDGKFGVVGAVSFDRFFSTVRLGENGEFCAISNLNEHLYRFDTFCVTPKRRIFTDLFLIAVSDADALPLYGKTIASERGVCPKTDPITGWCSWYYYGSGVSERAILENLSVIGREKLPIEYVQIDEGWEETFGDWEANDKFPSGMKAVADRIKSAGFIPGIWVAPFQFSTESKTFQAHPDWFLYHSDYVNGKRAYIDYSRPEAKKYLFDLFHKLSVEWGYRYIKIDLIIDAIALGGYDDPDRNMVSVFRDAWRIVKSAVTDDTVLLSCSSPIGASVGADSIRIGMDIFESWNALKNVARQVLKRLYVREYALIDPDCIMLRTSEKEDGECFRFCTRKGGELRVFLTFLSVCGGTVMFSDKLSLLNESDFSLMKSLFPLNKKAATAVDLYERDIPCVFSYGKRGKFEMFAVLNWTDEEKTFSLSLPCERFGRTLFSKAELQKNTRFTVVLPPREAEIYYFAAERKDFETLTDSIMPVAE